MPRAATTLDTFNAIAEPKRRNVLEALARGGGEMPVTALVDVLAWPQPQVSKHLAVLRQVGVVSVRRQGRKRMYSVNGEKLRTIHDWATLFERFWEHKLLRIKGRAEAAAGSDSAKSHLAKSATAKSATAKSATAKSDSAKPSGKAAHPKATDSQEP